MSGTLGIERLHKRIAASGICSRRAAEKLIAEGRVLVNGELVTEMGVKVGPEDKVQVDGKTLQSAPPIYLIMNKPLGIVTTLRDPQGRPTVGKLLPKLGVQVKPVGRLDMESEGLLVFTNDGELAHRMTHPRYGLEKEYVAVVQGLMPPDVVDRLRSGVYIEGGRTAPAKVEIMHVDPKLGRTTLMIVIHEGRNRQIRQMGDAVGFPVMKLKRVRIGSIVLRKLAPGQVRRLSVQEVEGLRSCVGLTGPSSLRTKPATEA